MRLDIIQTLLIGIACIISLIGIFYRSIHLLQIEALILWLVIIIYQYKERN